MQNNLDFCVSTGNFATIVDKRVLGKFKEKTHNPFILLVNTVWQQFSAPLAAKPTFFVQFALA